MPYFGLLPFLPPISLTLTMMGRCFNALLRASSFSTIHVTSKAGEDGNMFQCPTSGFFLFYNRRNGDIMKTKESFNALLRASSFSTLCLYSH